MILITRPKTQALATKAELKSKGYNVVCYPLLKIEYVNSIKPDIRSYKAIIISSQNAVYTVKDFIELKNKDIYVIGGKTAEALKGYGFSNIVSISDNQDDLVTQIEESFAYEGKILFIRGDHVAGNIKQKLHNKYDIEEWVVYRSIANHMSRKLLCLLEHKVTYVLFYSPRTAGVFVKNASSQDLANITAICISQNTANKLSSLNFKEIKIAKHPSEKSMLELL